MVKGQQEIGIGNLIGSNIMNLLLVLGAAAVLQTIEIQGSVIRREVPLLLLVTTIMTVMALDAVLEGGHARIGVSDAVVLLLLFTLFIYVTLQDVVLSKKDDGRCSRWRKRSMRMSRTTFWPVRWST